MTKSPYHITYADLVKLSQERLNIMVKTYQGKVMTGQLHQWTATHRIESEKVLLKLLKRFQKDPQLDLMKEFDKINKTGE